MCNMRYIAHSALYRVICECIRYSALYSIRYTVTRPCKQCMPAKGKSITLRNHDVAVNEPSQTISVHVIARTTCACHMGAPRAGVDSRKRVRHAPTVPLYIMRQQRPRFLLAVSAFVCRFVVQTASASGMTRTKQTCCMSTNGGVGQRRVNVDLTSGSGTGSDSESGEDRESKRSRLLVDQAVDVASPQQQQQVLLV